MLTEGTKFVGNRGPHPTPVQARSIENIPVYNAQGVLQVLGYDQRAVRSTGDMAYSNALVLKNKFVDEGRM